ncbi:hypothetical protein GALMADRAFT_233715 [Galerina marginata CBS 339.88]|uniref:Uncharacterized protein n=1 Tax=Galerina marginata (strain CBS 339.88) TaxID=685588 RepID=A0A067TYM6_GALM3|nr:hypothetical protein GALMADRAFT_233715 [Galerina marginata CBS 339.88]
MSAKTTHLAFFASAASSFQPAPYTPASQSSSARSHPHATRTNRSHESLAIPPPGMDPQPTDPDVLFIHPPFTTFPNSHLHSDGLTYSLMADNPEWFLVAHDFISQPNSNNNGIPYPPHLEPPRGWCPAKKKDLKDRGGEGWPEGEEPRLRCTFCRRTYAGVNAKSMWRRHVFEKHKIAMSNRRDGNVDRPRGRGSGKENRNHASTRLRDEAHDSLVSMVVAPQTAPEILSSKSRFRTAKPAEISRRRRDRETKNDEEDCLLLSTAASSRSPQKAFTDHSEDDSDADPPARAVSPPLTPHLDGSSDPPYIYSSNSDETLVKSPVPRPIIPESPYNPLQTPSFRHSPPRLPSDQPWRFPSPSHPLSTIRDISLTMLAPSPVKGGPLGGPMAILDMHSSPVSSPAALLSDSSAFETPARSKVLFSKSINRPFFLKDSMSSPLSSVKQYRKHPQGSPINRRPLAISHTRQRSDLSEVWYSEDSLRRSPSGANSDPFSVYDSWPSIGDETQISPVRLVKAPLEPESPVLRSGALPTVVALGIGLLEPFVFPKEERLKPDLTDITLSPRLGANPRLEGKRPAVLTNEAGSPAEVDCPPLKKRRVSPETTDT